MAGELRSRDQTSNGGPTAAYMVILRNNGGAASYWVSGTTFNSSLGAATHIALSSGTFAGDAYFVGNFPTALTTPGDYYGRPYTSGDVWTGEEQYLPWTGTAVLTGANAGQQITVETILAGGGTTLTSGEITKSELSAYQFAGFSFIFPPLLDAAGDPRDISGHSLSAIFFREGSNISAFTIGAGLTVVGIDNNEVMLADDGTHTGTPGLFSFIIRDATAGRAWQWGTLDIIPAPAS